MLSSVDSTIITILVDENKSKQKVAYSSQMTHMGLPDF